MVCRTSAPAFDVVCHVEATLAAMANAQWDDAHALADELSSYLTVSRSRRTWHMAIRRWCGMVMRRCERRFRERPRRRSLSAA